MKTIAKRISAIFMSVLLVATMLPLAALADQDPIPKSVVEYRSSKTGDSYVSFYISGLSSSQKIAKSSVKSSKPSIMTVRSLTNSSNTSKTEFYDGAKDSSVSSRSASISLIAKKSGTSTISYKIGSKTYKTKVTVKSYVNPIKKLTISGVNSSNLAGKFKNAAYASGTKVSSTKSNGTVKVTAASGWKITSVYLYDQKTNISRSVNSYSKPVSSATLYTGKIYKGRSYSVSINLENTKDGGTQYISLNLG